MDKAIALLADPSDLYLLKANVAFKLHRLDDVRAALSAAPLVRDSREARMLAADLAFQEGRYDAARAGYDELIVEERSWTASRVSHISCSRWATPRAPRFFTKKPKTS